MISHLESRNHWLYTLIFVALAYLLMAIGTFFLATAVIFIPSDASAHDAPPTPLNPNGWRYPSYCCSNKDCQRVSAKLISEKPKGYLVSMTGETVQYDDVRLKNSPDGEYHWCGNIATGGRGRQQGSLSHTVCLFVPPRGY